MAQPPHGVKPVDGHDEHLVAAHSHAHIERGALSDIAEEQALRQRCGTNVARRTSGVNFRGLRATGG